MTWKLLQAEDEDVWREDGERNGWTLAHKASWPFRLWGIRHIRFLYLDWRVRQAAGAWAVFGIGCGGPNQRDLWVLYAVLRGWC